MPTTYHLDQDVQEYVAMTEGFEEYVRGKSLYGNTTGGFFSSMPRLTTGSLLLRLRRLTAFYDTMNNEQQQAFDKAQELYESVFQEWHIHTIDKAFQEAHSRLDAMRTFFRECAENPRQAPSIYKPEAMRRTIVQELLPFLAEHHSDHKEVETKAHGIDHRLQSLLEPGDFLWADELQPIYPSHDYWWLYRIPTIPPER